MRNRLPHLHLCSLPRECRHPRRWSPCGRDQSRNKTAVHADKTLFQVVRVKCTVCVIFLYHCVYWCRWENIRNYLKLESLTGYEVERSYLKAHCADSPVSYKECYLVCMTVPYITDCRYNTESAIIHTSQYSIL